MNRLKKIVAITTIVSSLLMTTGPALAVTAEELQAQIDALLAQLASLQTQLAELQGETPTVTGCTITSFDRNLKLGMSGDDVKCLQIVLNSSADTQLASSGVGSPGNETSYFGPLTQAAVIKFQEKYASEVLASWGLTSGTGFVGSTTRAKLNTLLVPPGVVCGNGICETGETSANCPADCPVVPTADTVSLAADTPAAGPVALGAQNVVFTKVKFTAGSTAYTVSKILVARGGVSEDADISAVKLYEGATQLGSTQALNTTTHKATFSNLGWEIPANSTKTLTIKGSVDSGGTPGDSVTLGINALSDITATATLSGTFPMNGNARNLAGTSVGSLTIDAQGTPSGTVISGSTEQAVASFKFTTATEGFDIHSITFTESGSSVDSDVSNIKLMVGATQLGSTVESLTNGEATFDLSSDPYSILSGATKTLTLYVDVAANITASRNIRFEITQASDVTAYGANSGGAVEVSGTFPERGQDIATAQGTLTIAKDTAYAPSAQDYVLGQEQVLVNAYKFSAGATEGIRIVKLKFQLVGSDMEETDISNVNLVDAETEEVLAGPASAVSDYVTFGSNTEGLDSPGLFDISASGNRHILVKADVPSGADHTNDFGLEMADADGGDVLADGLTSEGDIDYSTFTDSTGTDAVTHDLNQKGSLTVSASGNTPAASTYPIGTTNYPFAKFDFTADMEDMLISALNIDFSENAASTSYTILSVSTDLTNIDLYDGDTLLDTDAALSSGVANFNIDLTVPADTTKTLTVKADIPSGSTASRTLTAWIGNSAGTDYQDNISTTGASSGQDIDESGTANALHGNLMTAGAPTVAVSMGTTPAAKNIMTNATGAHIGTMYFDTAASAEDIKITKIRVSFADEESGGDLDNTSADGCSANTDLSNVKLFEHGTTTQVGTTQPTITDVSNDYDYVDFSGLSFTIPKGSSKALDIKVDVEGSSGTYYVGYEDHTTTHFSGHGVSSGTDLTDATITDGGNGAGAAMAIQAKGTLTVSEYSDTPNAAIVAAGTTGHEFSTFKFAAADEDIILKALRIEVGGSGGVDADFAKVYVYHDGASIGEGYISSDHADIVFDSTVTVEEDSSELLTLVADINSIAVAGDITADAPTLAIDYNYTSGYWSGSSPSYSSKTNVEAVGADSGADITASNDVSGDGNGQTIYATELTANLNSNSPSGTLSQGTGREIARFDLTCASNVGHYDCTLEGLNLTFAMTNITIDDPILYRADTGATLATGSGTGVIPDSSDEMLFDLGSSAYTIPYGTTKQVYVKADVHYEGGTASTPLSGSVQARIADLTASTGDLYWKDGKVASDIKWIDVTGVSSIDGNSLTYSSATDSYGPFIVDAAMGTDTGTAGAWDTNGDELVLTFSEPIKEGTVDGSGAATEAEIRAITGVSTITLGTATITSSFSGSTATYTLATADPTTGITAAASVPGSATNDVMDSPVGNSMAAFSSQSTGTAPTL